MSQQVRVRGPGRGFEEVGRPSSTREYPRLGPSRAMELWRLPTGSHARARRSSGPESSCTGRQPEKKRTAHYPFSMQALVCKASRCTW
jgi:hypothetical protein